MPKDLGTGGLGSHLLSNVLTLARCWKITRQDGDVEGFTDHVRDLTVGSVTYLAASGLASTNFSAVEGLQVNNANVDAFLTAAVEEDVEAGRYDNATIELFLVNYLDTSGGTVILQRGAIGEISRADGMFKAEIRGLTQQLQAQFGRVYTPFCTVDLGDLQCKVKLEGSTQSLLVDFTASDDTINRDDDGSWFADGYREGNLITITGTVSNNGTFTIDSFPDASTLKVTGSLVDELGVTATIELINDFSIEGTVESVDSISPRRVFVDADLVRPTTGGAYPHGFFNEGRVQFTSGDNDGVTRDIRLHSASGRFETFLEFPSDIAVGNTFKIFAGCDKSFATCRDKFDNVINFRGFPDVPTTEQVHDSPINSGRTQNFTGL